MTVPCLPPLPPHPTPPPHPTHTQITFSKDSHHANIVQLLDVFAEGNKQLVIVVGSGPRGAKGTAVWSTCCDASATAC
jgi:hypothetical protein